MPTIYTNATVETLKSELADYNSLMDEALEDGDLVSAAYYRGQIHSINKALRGRWMDEAGR